MERNHAGLAVETFGTPDDPTLVLLAGASSSADWWDARLCTALADRGLHVVRYDHRDTGESVTDPPGEPSYRGATLRTDCLAVLDGLGVGAAHLLGQSMGGGLAQEVALREPARVRSLTVLSSTAIGGVTEDLPPPSPALQAAFAEPAPEPDWRDRAAVVDWWLDAERLFAGGADVDEDWVRTTAGLMWDRAGDLAASQNHWLVVGQDDGESGEEGAGESDVHRIACPTLVVHGAQDPLFPLPHGEALARAVPGARLLVLDDLGHQAPPPRTWTRLADAVAEHVTAAARAHAAGR